MKAWVSGGIAPLIINLASDPSSALLEVGNSADLRIERDRTGYRVVGCDLRLAMRQSI